MSHAGALGQGTPVRADLGQVRDLQGHAQADFSQPAVIVLHELHDVFALLGSEIVVLEQVSFTENLADAEYLVARGVQGEIQEVADRKSVV